MGGENGGSYIFAYLHRGRYVKYSCNLIICSSRGVRRKPYSRFVGTDNLAQTMAKLL